MGAPFCCLWLNKRIDKAPILNDFPYTIVIIDNINLSAAILFIVIIYIFFILTKYIVSHFVILNASITELLLFL